MIQRIQQTTLLIASLALVPACSREADQPPPTSGENAAAPTNRIDVPPAVRQNLGITFAKVESRHVARMVRVPGRFELQPTALREYHAPLGGRVELMVQQFQPIEPGAALYRLDAPRWRQMQSEIADAEAGVRRADAELESTGPLIEAHHRHHESLEATVRVWEERVRQLEQIREAGGGKAGDLTQARASLTTALAELADVAEMDAELQARRTRARAELDAARAKFDLLLASASTLLDVSKAALTEGATPAWRTISSVEIRAVTPGVVESLAVTPGAWLDERARVLITVQPNLLRFRARGLQSDLGRLRDGLPARVVPPHGGTLTGAEVMDGSLVIGLAADPDERTVDLLLTPAAPASWARAGVSAFLEITVDGTKGPELAAPLGAVIRDGLTAVVFRRDPKDPDKVIRLEADLGIDDGRYVVVRSGLKEGDEVVLDGVFQLMLASSGSAAKGGHFHADGTFHEGEDH